MKEEHPFLNDVNHRVEIIELVNKFLNLNFNLNIKQALIGHLFFGQRAFPLSGKDIGFVFGEKTKYYPEIENESIFPGPIILIDETGTTFHIGIAEISKDNLGLYFENILVNIIIKKDNPRDFSHFLGSNYICDIYSINNYGALNKIGLHNIEEIKNFSSGFILNFILFNLEKFSSS